MEGYTSVQTRQDWQKTEHTVLPRQRNPVRKAASPVPHGYILHTFADIYFYTGSR